MKAIRRIFNKFFSNIYAVMIGMFVISFTIFAIIVEGVGYLAFTSSFTEEYKESVYKSDLVAANYMENLTEIDKWQAVGGSILDKYYYGYFLNYQTYDKEFDYENVEKSAKTLFDQTGITDEELEAIDKKLFTDYDKIPEPGDRNYYTRMYYTIDSVAYAYSNIKQDLYLLADSQNLSVLYFIIPDKDYKTYTSIINCPGAKSGYTPWEPGSKHDTSPGGYEEAFKRIYEEGSEKEIIVRDKDLNGAKPHVTAMVPIYEKNAGTVNKDKIVGVLCAQRFMDELITSRRNFVQGVSAITVMLLIILTVLVIRFIKKRVIVPLEKVSREAERFAHETSRSEDSTLAENEGTIREIKSLASAIEKMEDDTLKNIDEITNMTRNSERMGYEVSLASQIQQGMLPVKEKDLKYDPRYDVHALMDPAKEVGGDFFDFFMIDDNHIAILVADVSDKGVAAAFFMAITKTLIKSRARLGGSASEILTYTDRLVAEKNPAGMFVTVWLGIVDLNTGYVNACNAGHDYPAIMTERDGYTIDKVQHGPPIGFIPGMDFIEYDYSLKPGDRIFLYTDGLPEAKAVNGDRFGTDRMLEILNSNRGKTNKEIVELMKNRVFSFAGDEPQFDDITMMSFTYYGQSKEEDKKEETVPETKENETKFGGITLTEVTFEEIEAEE
ncbi:MAG: SpoIIE family protein phosphatase [Eubacterium sp.]|nr:SpoIIE family protein phosphatase [Eubacterium sp.]